MDMKREKDKMEIRGDNKERREKGDESKGRVWKDKDWRTVVDLG